MITHTSAVSFRQNLGEMLNQVQYRRDSIVISKDGKPVAALVDAQMFERIRGMQARFDDLCARFQTGFVDMSEADGMAEIDKLVASERKTTKRTPTRTAKQTSASKRAAHRNPSRQR